MVVCFNINMWLYVVILVFFFKQKTAYEMRISDWSSDVCSSDLLARKTLQFLHQLDTVHVRHVQIAQHQADGGVFDKLLDGLLAGFARHATVDRKSVG